jgi:hypothetical protein
MIASAGQGSAGAHRARNLEGKAGGGFARLAHVVALAAGMRREVGWDLS